ncbi:MAG: sodium:proton antiporter [Gammaproteobacteria bacterium]|nr:sodium:proton antiporter [Gammaproteobacteria bacterium]
MSFYTITSIVLTIAVLIGYLNCRFIKMQPTVAITMGSLILSFVLILIGELGFHGLEYSVREMLRQIPFHDLLINGMLSFLLFSGALRIDINHLKKQKWEITVLALGGTIASTILIGYLTFYLLPLFDIHIKLIYCLMFGALISPTDPISVLATFKELDVPKKLAVIVEGESLFNDGVGIVIFITLYQLVTNGHAITFHETSLLFLRQAVGGIVFGGMLGLAAYWLMKPIDDHKIEILITLTIVTGGYTLARFLGISGPLAMVVAGIFIGNRGRNFSMSAKTVKSLDNFWELVEEILNTILFLLIGLELLAINISSYQIIAALIAIPVVLLVRAIVVTTPMSIFKIWNKYPNGVIRILIWGGLRGGLALALALSLPQGYHHDLIISMTYAVVAFAIVVQGITIKPLVRKNKYTLRD